MALPQHADLPGDPPAERVLHHAAASNPHGAALALLGQPDPFETTILDVRAAGG
jgi:hypothetical protein